MKKPLLLLVILPFFCSARLCAQNTGHMGKHVALNAEVINSPCYFQKNHNGRKGFLAFDYILAPNIEIAVAPKILVGGSFTYLKSLFQEEDYTMWEIGTKDYHYTAMGGGLFLKGYFGDKKCFLGNFFRIEFDVLQIKEELSDREDPDLEHLMFGARFELGKDFLFFDRLKLTMAIGVGTLLGTDGKGLPLLLSQMDVDGVQNAQDRATANYFFGLRMGIGILAF